MKTIKKYSLRSADRTTTISEKESEPKKLLIKRRQAINSIGSAVLHDRKLCLSSPIAKQTDASIRFDKRASQAPEVVVDKRRNKLKVHEDTIREKAGQSQRERGRDRDKHL
jgi:hypothetical protein